MQGSNMAAPKAPQDNSQEVLAYRVGQLETAFDKGITKLETKIDTITSSFATKVELEELESHATVEHKRIEKKIDDTKITLEGEMKSMKSSRWIQNTLSAIFGAVLTLLISYFFNDIVK